MKLIVAIGLIAFIDTAASCQNSRLLAEHKVFRDELLNKYKKLKASPDERTLLTKLEGLPFFPFDSALQIRAVLDTISSSGFLPMKTSRGRDVLYRRYGYLSFSIGGRPFRMPVYQGRSEANAGSDELFFPFTDDTNGETTYGGGRYIDLHIPQETEITLDFNRAYNPYCAYSHLYSCEIPPDENHFTIRIEAGLKY